MKFKKTIFCIIFLLLFSLIYIRTENKAEEEEALISEYMDEQEISLSEDMAKYMERITIDREKYYAGLYLSIEDIYQIYSDSDMIDWNSKESINKAIREKAYCWKSENGSYYILGENGYVDYTIMYAFPGESISYNYPAIVSSVTCETIFLDGDKEKLKTFVNQNHMKLKEIRQNVKWIKENLKDSEYGGMYYNAADRKIHIWLSKPDMRDKLEKMGYICENTLYSNEYLYVKLQELWERKEELKICYAAVDSADNQLSVTGSKSEDEFFHMIGIKDKEKITYNQGLYLNGSFAFTRENIEYSYNSLEDIMKLGDFLYSGWMEKNKNRLYIGIETLKNYYSSYTYANLLNKLSYDFNWKRYISFDKEVLDFVDTLPEYAPNHTDPMEEEEFGDPDRLELKSLLEDYKRIYPDKNYKQIYSEYLSEWEEQPVFSREQKLFNLGYRRSKGKTGWKESEEEQKIYKDNLSIAIFGGAMLVLGEICLYKKKKCKK